MATNEENGSPSHVPVILDVMTFQEIQKKRLEEIEARIEEETRKKKKEWEREVERMKEEFLKLLPADQDFDELDKNDPMIFRRRGSTDVLDRRKMKTLFLTYPDSGRRFKLRFDVSDFIPESVHFTVENDIITVTAKKKASTDSTDGTNGGEPVEKEYCRKIEKPPEVDANKLKSFLTNDGILIVEAPLPPDSLNFRKHSHHTSPSRSRSSIASSRSRSPSNSPRTPSSHASGSVSSISLPQFSGVGDDRRMNLIVEIAGVESFGPRDVSIHVIKENRICVKAKREEKTSDRFMKDKFSREYELPERIHTDSVRAALSKEGKLVIYALSKEQKKNTCRGNMIKEMEEELLSESTMELCHVLDLASFPPTALT